VGRVAARCACQRCRTDAARYRGADRRNASVGRSTRHLAVADDHSTRYLVAAGEHSTRRSAGVDHLTRSHEAIDRGSPAVGQFDAPPAGRRSRRLELHFGRLGCRFDPDVPGVLVVADVRSLMGVGRTA